MAYAWQMPDAPKRPPPLPPISTPRQKVAPSADGFMTTAAKMSLADMALQLRDEQLQAKVIHYKAELATSPELDAVTDQVIAELAGLQAAARKSVESKPPTSELDRSQIEIELIQSLKTMLGRIFRPNRLATVIERKLGEVSKRFARVFFESELHEKIRGSADEVKAMRFPDQALYHAFTRHQEQVLGTLNGYQYAAPNVVDRARDQYFLFLKSLRNDFLARTTPELNVLVNYLNDVLTDFFTKELPPMLGDLAWEVVKDAKLAQAKTIAGYKISATSFATFRSVFERRFLQRLVPFTEDEMLKRVREQAKNFRSETMHLVADPLIFSDVCEVVCDAVYDMLYNGRLPRPPERTGGSDSRRRDGREPHEGRDRNRRGAPRRRSSRAPPPRKRAFRGAPPRRHVGRHGGPHGAARGGRQPRPRHRLLLDRHRRFDRGQQGERHPRRALRRRRDGPRRAKVERCERARAEPPSRERARRDGDRRCILRDGVRGLRRREPRRHRERGEAVRLFVFSLLALATACSLTTSLEGLSGGGASSIDDANDAATTGADATTSSDGAVVAPDAPPIEHCTTIGPRYPTDESAPTWTMPQNVEAQDDEGARAQVYNGKKASIDVRAFGFSIPTAARITGVEVAVRRASDGEKSFRDDSITLDVSGSADRASAAFWPMTTYETRVFGDPTDTWSVPLTPSMVNATGFGVTYVARYAATAGNAYGQVDSISMTITYCE